MQINIFPPVALCERGRRSKNEDNIYPAIGQATTATNTFLVCDGVGGAEKGEVASQIVTSTFGAAFDQQIANARLLHSVLDQVQSKVDEYIRKHKVKGMGTTLTFLQLNEQGAIIAHAGDSRVYHVRGNKILFCTSDHSLVNELKKKGLHEEAALAGDNIITRAIQGASVKEINLDVQHIADIQTGDYFLLCSDGVWGVIPDEKIVRILTAQRTDEEKIEKIQQYCIQSSKDNYSAYLIKVKSVSRVPINDATVFSVPRATSKTSEFERPRVLVENTQKTQGFNWLKPLAILSLLGAIGLGTWYFLEQEHKSALEENHVVPNMESTENQEMLLLEKSDSTEAQNLKLEAATKKRPKKKKTKKTAPSKSDKKEIVPVQILSKDIAPVIPLEVLNEQHTQLKKDSELIPPPSILIDSVQLDSLNKK